MILNKLHGNAKWWQISRKYNFYLYFIVFYFCFRPISIFSAHNAEQETGRNSEQRNLSEGRAKKIYSNIFICLAWKFTLYFHSDTALSFTCIVFVIFFFLFSMILCQSWICQILCRTSITDKLMLVFQNIWYTPIIVGSWSFHKMLHQTFTL